MLCFQLTPDRKRVIDIPKILCIPQLFVTLQRQTNLKMKQEVNPKDTDRAIAFELWMKSPMPMVTLTKTFDVTRLCKISRRRGLKFNMLLSGASARRHRG